ncbi:MAG: hypothetical protein ABIK47_07725 [candidate division WOR-3 bacterium]
MANHRQKTTGLKRALQRLRRTLIFYNLFALALITVGLLSLGTLVVALLFLSGWVVLIFLLPVFATGFFWLRETKTKKIGYKVERVFPVLQGRLVAAIELTEYQPDFEGYSLSLRDAAVKQVEEALKPLPLNKIMPQKRLLWSGLFAVLSIGLFLGYFGIDKQRVELGLLNGFSPERLEIAIAAFPQDTAVLPGSEVELGCRIKPEGIFKWVRLEMQEGSRAFRVHKKNLRLDGDSCRFNIIVNEGFKFRFRVLSRGSDWFRVGLIEPLTLKRLSFICHPPGYSRLPEVRVSGTGLAVLKGTRVDFEAEASATVERARVILGEETVWARIDERDWRRFSGSFVVMKDGVGTVEMAGADGNLRGAASFDVRVLLDEPPFVKVFIPGRDVDLPMSMKVLLGINTIDDYGLNELWLHYGKDSIANAVRLRRLDGKLEDTTLYVWDLSSSGLVPGEAMRYFVRVSDNDQISGPKSTKSEVFSVRFPTMPEIYSAAVERTGTTQSELEPLQGEQARIGEELARVAEELKKNRELSWEERRRLEDVVHEQAALLEKIEDLKEDVAKAAQEILEGMSWDKETLERLGQLQELLSRLLPKELQEALKELARKLGERGSDLRQALERVQVEQEKLQAGIERALELLKRIMEEVKLEALAKQAEELKREQTKITEMLAKETGEELLRQQEAINSGLDSLEKGMKELADEVSEEAIAESLEAIGEQLKARDIKAMAAKMKQELATGDKKLAKERSEQLAQSFKEMEERLKNLSEGLKKSRSAEVLRRMMAGGDELLTISQEEERLEEKLRQGAAPQAIANEQMALLEATRISAESLLSLGAQTMAIPPTLGQELARALKSMKEAASLGAERRGANMGAQMQAARQSLNRAVEMLLAAADKMQQGGGLAGGLQNLLEQLSQMTSEQLAINAGTAGLPIPIPMGGLGAGQMEQLMKLLAQQQALRRQLEELLQSMGGERPGLTGSLEQLLEEMKGVERALSELQIDRKLIERQEGIVHKLLDAQRSLRQEGFKEQRESETAKEYQLEAPSGLPEDLGERNRRLREELLRALKQGYPLEYERLIRAYFERLLER